MCSWCAGSPAEVRFTMMRDLKGYMDGIRHDGAVLRELQENVAYKLVETKAPTGYVLATDPFYFWIRPTATAVAPASKPTEFTGTAVDSGGVLNIANEPDETVVTTELTIRKAWEYTHVDPPTRISVDIYQIAMKEGVEFSRSLFKTVNLSKTL